MAENQTLAVHLYGKRIGLLSQTAAGKMRFAYDTTSRPCQLSIGMPVQAEAYDETHTEAYFGGLLPESEMAKKAIGNRYGVNANNSFSLLSAIGYDCAGAVSLHPIDDSPSDVPTRFPLEGTLLSETNLHQHIRELPQKPLFIGVDGLRLSLAGAQDKAAVCLIENQIALPNNGCPTTHILKPVIQGFDGIVHNEYLCLKLASQVGLTVPEIEIRWAEDIPYLLVERYDREVQDSHVKRIHQEDFCQALGKVSAFKYQNHGGPGFTDCFDLLRDTTNPAKERNTLASLMVFNYLIGNMDAHGKNFSLLHRFIEPITIEAPRNTRITIRESNRIGLTPVYDIVCTQIYKDLSNKMAMKIGGYYEPEQIMPRHWERQCKEMGYSYPALRQLIHKHAHTILEAMHLERQKLKDADLFHPVIDQLLTFWEQHIQKTLKRFENPDI